MMEFISFNTVDEMVEFQRKAREQADSMVEGWQAAIKPGDYCMTFVPDYELIIYYEILEDTPEPGEPHQPLLEHSRFVRGYSIAEPDGELGYLHVSTVLGLLTKKQFEEARMLEWPSSLKEFAVIVHGDPAWKLRQDI